MDVVLMANYSVSRGKFAVVCCLNNANWWAGQWKTLYSSCKYTTLRTVCSSEISPESCTCTSGELWNFVRIHISNYIQKSEQPSWHSAPEMYICGWWAEGAGWVLFIQMYSQSLSHTAACCAPLAFAFFSSDRIHTTILMSVLAPEPSVHLHPQLCLEVPDAGHLMYSLPPIIGTTHQCCVLYQFVVFAKCE